MTLRDCDFDLVFLYTMRRNGKKLTVSQLSCDTIHLEKQDESTKALEQHIIVQRKIFNRMMDVFHLTDQMEYILAHGSLDYAVHQATVYKSSGIMEADSEKCKTTDDFMLTNKCYMRLSFVMYSPGTYKRSFYFHMKKFCEISQEKWEKKQVSMNLREFCGIIAYTRKHERKEWESRLANSIRVVVVEEEAQTNKVLIYKENTESDWSNRKLVYENLSKTSKLINWVKQIACFLSCLFSLVFSLGIYEHLLSLEKCAHSAFK